MSNYKNGVETSVPQTDNLFLRLPLKLPLKSVTPLKAGVYPLKTVAEKGRKTQLERENRVNFVLNGHDCTQKVE